MCRIYKTDNLTKERKRKYRRSEVEIIKDFGDTKSKYARSDAMEKTMKNYRDVKSSNNGINRLHKQKQRENFRQLLGFKENEVYESKEYSITKKIRKIFKNHVINEQYRIKNNFVDLCFPEHKLGIEIDENGHTGRSKTEEEKREKTTKEKTRFRVIRIKLNKEYFDIDDEIGEIHDLYL